jgi:hypothetical protein
MPTGAADNFAHGTYGDISGVTFYGPPVNGFWEDSFPVSDRFFDPLFRAILDRAERVERTNVPRMGRGVGRVDRLDIRGRHN